MTWLGNFTLIADLPMNLTIDVACSGIAYAIQEILSNAGYTTGYNSSVTMTLMDPSNNVVQPVDPSFMLCSVEAQIVLPDELAVSDAESFMATRLAAYAYYLGHIGNVSATLNSVGTGTIANPTTPVALPVLTG